VLVVCGFIVALGLLLVVSRVAGPGPRHVDQVAAGPRTTRAAPSTTAATTTTVYTPRSSVPLTDAPATTSAEVSTRVAPPRIAGAVFDPECGAAIAVTVTVLTDPSVTVLSALLTAPGQTIALAPIGGSDWQATVAVSAPMVFRVVITDSAGGNASFEGTLAPC
jgi:hypothetical protein